QAHQLEHISNLGRRQSIDVVEHNRDRLRENGERPLELGSSSADSFLSTLEDLAQDPRRPATALDPRADKRKPRHARESLAIILEVPAHLCEARTDLQLGGEFDEERLDQLLRAAEHPRIEVEYWHAGSLELIASEIYEGCLSGTPSAEDPNYNALSHIQI